MSRHEATTATGGTDDRAMRAIRVGVVVLVGVLGLGLVAPGWAAAPLAQGTDTHGDVKITRTKHLPNADRRSIDLRLVRVTDSSRNRVRFTVGIKKIVRSSRFDQMVFINLTPPPASGHSWAGQVGFTSKGSAGYAALDPGDGEVGPWCDLRRTIRKPRLARIAVEVPRRCIPEDSARVRVYAATGHFRSDAPQWSWDRLRVRGTAELTP